VIFDKAVEAARAMKASNRKRYTSEEVAPILDALLELTKPLEDERLEGFAWEADHLEARDMPGTAAIIRDLIAEVRRLRAGEDTQLLDWVEKTVSDCYRFPKSSSATGFIYVCFDANAQEHRAETLRGALRAAIAESK
jgi:hypothetical protein